MIEELGNERIATIRMYCVVLVPQNKAEQSSSPGTKTVAMMVSPVFSARGDGQEDQDDSVMV